MFNCWNSCPVSATPHFPSFLQGIVEIISVKAEQKGIQFIYQPVPNLPQGIIADEKRLRQILINLLGNAVKFTDSGKVVFQVKTCRAKLNKSVELSNKSLETMTTIQFEVQDTGVGIPPEKIDTILIPLSKWETKLNNLKEQD